MRILFDHGTPVPLRRALTEHAVATAYEMGWAGLDNGELLKAAETAFEVLITTDQSLPYQQNLKGGRLAVLVLPTTSWPNIESHVAEVVAAVSELHPGELRVLIFSK